MREVGTGEPVRSGDWDWKERGYCRAGGSEMTGAGERVRGHLVDSKRMALNRIEKVGMWRREGQAGRM